MRNKYIHIEFRRIGGVLKLKRGSLEYEIILEIEELLELFVFLLLVLIGIELKVRSP